MNNLFRLSSLYLFIPLLTNSNATPNRRNFPSFVVLALFQQLVTIPITYLYAGRPTIHWSEFLANMPLATVYALNVASGLLGTGALSVPMFVALRRCSLLITIGLEYYLYGRKRDKRTLASVSLMFTGALVATFTDPSFSLSGSIAVMLNNITSAYYMIEIKNRRIEGFTREKTMLYNAMAAAPVLLLATFVFPGEWKRVLDFPFIHDLRFQLALMCSASLGVVVTHATFVCTQINDPLTTNVVGVVKSIVTSIIGALIFPDYIFSLVNVLALGVSTIGAIAYVMPTAPLWSPSRTR
jgi:solute carrier family 35 protein